MAFNKNLKNLRKQAGITQDALANACCVHYQTVSKWERGIIMPEISLLGVIANTLNTSLEALLDCPTTTKMVSGVFDQVKMASAITRLRKSKNLTQAELALIINVSSDIVSKWERCITSPDIETIKSLSAFFNVSVSALYFGEALLNDAVIKDNNIIDNLDGKIKDKSKKASKKVLIIILALIAFVASAIGGYFIAKSINQPPSSGGYGPQDVGPVKYTLSTITNTYIVTGYDGEEEVLQIPSTYNGVLVTGIGDNAFNGNTVLRQVTIPKSINKIGVNAFGGCVNLTSVTFISTLNWTCNGSAVIVSDASQNALNFLGAWSSYTLMQS